ncbi:MAG: methylmalonyl Co-A mutase-associated GTPase MeaB [Bacteriovoracaceae bacterium]|nr:methylmalonyl Co-A mutase-associated GTPase MeaB [Bacteriovoracaceae bacterium]
MTIDLKKLKSGDRRTLAKAITLVESQNTEHQKEAQALIKSILPSTGNSFRIGISGSPGVGKSTFIEALGKELTESGKKVAVLAVDPTSPISGGSILGDKTRMEELSQDKNAFIRPSPSSGSLGGIAFKTREALLLCEAAGFEIILIETVGVGQSEFEVADLVDYFTLLMLPGGGDELQGIKKGILELADVVVVNKADRNNKENAENTKQDYQNAFNLMAGHDKDVIQVMTCSALEKQNIKEVYSHVFKQLEEKNKDGSLSVRRQDQNKSWFKRLVDELLKKSFFQDPTTLKLYEELLTKVAENKMNPLEAATNVMKKFLP